MAGILDCLNVTKVFYEDVGISTRSKRSIPQNERKGEYLSVGFGCLGEALLHARSQSNEMHQCKGLHM